MAKQQKASANQTCLNNQTIGENGSAKDAVDSIKSLANAQQQIKPATNAARMVTLQEHAWERTSSTEFKTYKPSKRSTWPSTKTTQQCDIRQAKSKSAPRVNQVKEPRGARTSSRQKDSNGHNPLRKNSKRRNKGLFKNESRHMCRYQHHATQRIPNHLR